MKELFSTAKCPHCPRPVEVDEYGRAEYCSCSEGQIDAEYEAITTHDGYGWKGACRVLLSRDTEYVLDFIDYLSGLVDKTIYKDASAYLAETIVETRRRPSNASAPTNVAGDSCKSSESDRESNKRGSER